MKFYKNLVEAISISVLEIFNEDKYTERVVEKILKSNPKWGARDRSFIAENVYDCVRNKRLLLYLAGVETINSNSVWSILAVLFVKKYHELPDWTEFSTINKNNLLEITSAEYIHSLPLAIAQSYPDWLSNLLSSEIGERWTSEAFHLNLSAEVVLRVNTLKTNRTKLQELLKQDEIETFIPLNDEYKDALLLRTRKNIQKNKWFEAGYFEIQDAGSQSIAPYLEVEPGMTVIDACAGAGGKALHLASLMKNKGKIIAMDVEAWKLKNLQERAKRAGINIIETQIINASILKELKEKADALLLDVPCSGIGVFKRNPDSKWKLSNDSISDIQQTQASILENYSTMLKINGKMVYATCSILPSENEFQVNSFLKNHPSFTLLHENTTFPSAGFDGFYKALLKK